MQDCRAKAMYLSSTVGSAEIAESGEGFIRLVKRRGGIAGPRGTPGGTPWILCISPASPAKCGPLRT